MNRIVLGRILLACATTWTTVAGMATEWHVSPAGNDTQPGSKSAPFRTIQKAADLAQPGDVITVHAGTYRERVNPPRGGESDRRRITYRAAPGEAVEILGSEIVDPWVKAGDGVWKVTLSNAFFGAFNPYADLIRGDWFEPKGRSHHTGAVYFDGEWLAEAARLEDLSNAGAGANAAVPVPGTWFAQVDAMETTIWARFPADPAGHRIEINVRRTVFYPDQPGRDFITVRGFTMRHAATPWAPPTAEQVGLIGTHWSKGWVIEDNVIRYSMCSGISLGKHGDRWDNTSANSAEGYVKTIERALERGWHRDRIGHHVVRNNTISHCEQAGIVGSLGAAFSTVTGNTIHDIHVRRAFTGAEMAGIKFHAAIDTVIRGNHIHRTCLGLWLDWMAQGTRVSGNVFHDNAGQDLFVEVNHGPFLVDNNFFLSPVAVLDMSEGGAFAHNLFLGKIISRPEPGRETPFHPPHATEVAGLSRIRGGDVRYYNNLFVGGGTGAAAGESAKDPEWKGGFGTWVYDFRDQPSFVAGNVYLKGARPYSREEGGEVDADHDPKVAIGRTNAVVELRAAFGSAPARAKTAPVTTERLGKARISGAAYENADGTPTKVDRDFLGKKRDRSHPAPG
ncbi:MAG: right-handed parallel beta-helix repeat-containing protein, partial [Verrucomicrobiales bacterium]|nr:right-handed parallel beta-helix repeat-containing protein [Verrucomicrobiales bacterium]